MPNSYSASLNYLDEIPDNIYQRLVTHQYRMASGDISCDSLQQRVQGVMDLRIQLLKGETQIYSNLLQWLDPGRAEILHDHLKDHSLLKNTFDNEAYTDDFLLNLLSWLDHADIKTDWSTDFKVLNSDSVDSNYNKNNQTHLKHNTDNYSIKKDNNLQRSIQEINSGFALQRSVGWDLIQGVNSTTDVSMLVTFHTAVKKSPQIQSIIRMIGRHKHKYIDQIKVTGLNQTVSEKNNIPDNRAVNSVSGLCLGDDVSKMLSMELAQLASNKLKILWHARRAERQLLNYHYQGLLSDHVPDIQPYSLDFSSRTEETVKSTGPMILCVDTSASMKGRAEFISKAIAFEAMRIAHIEKRGCYLFCFGGTDEIVQLELNLKTQSSLNDGWNAILKFLSFSFNGGTNINNVILQALDIQTLKRWNNADLLLISDGLFKVDDLLTDRLLLTEKSLRIFGIQLCKWRSDSLRQICHSVFHVTDI